MLATSAMLSSCASAHSVFSTKIKKAGSFSSSVSFSSFSPSVLRRNNSSVRVQPIVVSASAGADGRPLAVQVAGVTMLSLFLTLSPMSQQAASAASVKAAAAIPELVSFLSPFAYSRCTPDPRHKTVTSRVPNWAWPKRMSRSTN